MPVGAIIGGIATVGGALLANKGADKQANAVKSAADSSNATNLQIYNQQRQDLMPWMTTGKAALSQIEKLLGLSPAATAPAGQTPQPAGQSAQQSTGYQAPMQAVEGGRPQRMADRFGGQVSDYTGGGQATTQPVGTPTQVPQNALGTTTPAAGQAGQYDGFYNSPGYQFRLGEGQRQLNTGLASRGQLFSGDAGREAIKYGQNFASNEYNTYLNQLFNAAGMGQTSTGQSNAAGANYAQGVNQNNMATGNALASSYGTQANSWQNALGTVGGMAMKYWG